MRQPRLFYFPAGFPESFPALFHIDSFQGVYTETAEGAGRPCAGIEVDLIIIPYTFRADDARAETAENSVFSAAAIGLCMTEKDAAQRKSAETGFGFFGKFSLLYRNEYMVK